MRIVLSKLEVGEAIANYCREELAYKYSKSGTNGQVAVFSVQFPEADSSGEFVADITFQDEVKNGK